ASLGVLVGHRSRDGHGTLPPAHEGREPRRALGALGLVVVPLVVPASPPAEPSAVVELARVHAVAEPSRAHLVVGVLHVSTDVPLEYEDPAGASAPALGWLRRVVEFVGHRPSIHIAHVSFHRFGFFTSCCLRSGSITLVICTSDTRSCSSKFGARRALFVIVLRLWSLSQSHAHAMRARCSASSRSSVMQASWITSASSSLRVMAASSSCRVRST